MTIGINHYTDAFIFKKALEEVIFGIRDFHQVIFLPITGFQ